MPFGRARGCWMHASAKSSILSRSSGSPPFHLFSCMPRPLRSFARLASAVDDAPPVSIDDRIALRELPFALPTGGRPRQAAISDAIRSAMQVGRLRPGARLPSSRDLARQLRVARGTVVLAYEQLRAEGYLRAAHGAGTSVVDSLPEGSLGLDSTSASAPRTN